MIEGERAEFETLLGELFGAYGLMLTREKTEGFWRALSRMGLTEFVRARDRLLRDLEDGQSVPRPFSVATVWDARKRTRAQAPALFEHEKPPDDWQGDGWDSAANHHLLAHIRGKLARNAQRYGRPASFLAMRKTRSKNADASPEFIANVHALVAAKNAWAADMRDLSANTANGEVPVETQRAVWSDYLNRAESDIASGRTSQLQLTGN